MRAWPATIGIAWLAAQSPVPAQTPQTATAIYGSVSDAAGHPVPGVIITAQAHGSDRLVLTRVRGDGTFRQSLEAGAYLVTASLDGFDPVRMNRVTIANGEEKALPITIGASVVCDCVVDAQAPRRGQLTGVVRDISGMTLPFAVVMLSGGALRTPVYGFTDTFGRYAASVPEGDYALQFSFPGRAPTTERRIQVVAGRALVTNADLQVDSSVSAPLSVERLRAGCDCPSAIFEHPAWP